MVGTGWWLMPQAFFDTREMNSSLLAAAVGGCPGAEFGAWGNRVQWLAPQLNVDKDPSADIDIHMNKCVSMHIDIHAIGIRHRWTLRYLRVDIWPCVLVSNYIYYICSHLHGCACSKTDNLGFAWHHTMTSYDTVGKDIYIHSHGHTYCGWTRVDEILHVNKLGRNTGPPGPAILLCTFFCRDWNLCICALIASYPNVCIHARKSSKNTQLQCTQKFKKYTISMDICMHCIYTYINMCMHTCIRICII